MNTIAKPAWMALMLRGIISVIFGLFAFFYPYLTMATLVMLIGIFITVNGILTIIMAFTYKRHNDHWWNYLLQGLISLVLGILIMTWPGITAILLFMIVAAWIIIVGIIEIIAYINLRQLFTNNLILVVAGILSVLLGLYFIRFPKAGIFALIWLIGIYAIFIGSLSIIAAIKLKKSNGNV
jgi:uncharacterized membrane protein HdeD (DUF308 family)